MRIAIRVTTGARQERVEKVNETLLSVAVKERPIDGAANRAVERIIAEYFDVAPSRVRICRGHRSRVKIVDIV